jgi:hypothetical protein
LRNSVYGLCHTYIELSRSGWLLARETMEPIADPGPQLPRAPLTRLSDASRLEIGRIGHSPLECEIALPGRERP